MTDRFVLFSLNLVCSGFHVAQSNPEACCTLDIYGIIQCKQGFLNGIEVEGLTQTL